MNHLTCAGLSGRWSFPVMAPEPAQVSSAMRTHSERNLTRLRPFIDINYLALLSMIFPAEADPESAWCKFSWKACLRTKLRIICTAFIRLIERVRPAAWKYVIKIGDVMSINFICLPFSMRRGYLIRRKPWKKKPAPQNGRIQHPLY